MQRGNRMPIHIKLNEKDLSLEILSEKNEPITIEQENVSFFFKQIDVLREKHGYLFQNFEHQITLRDLNEYINKKESKLIGLNFFGERLVRVDHVSFYATAIFDDEDDFVIDVPIDDNFTFGYLSEGEISNFDIRNCLDKEVIELLKENPDMYVSFDDVNITTEVLYSKEKDTYTLEVSYDT